METLVFRYLTSPCVVQHVCLQWVAIPRNHCSSIIQAKKEMTFLFLPSSLLHAFLAFGPQCFLLALLATVQRPGISEPKKKTQKSAWPLLCYHTMKEIKLSLWQLFVMGSYFHIHSFSSVNWIVLKLSVFQGPSFIPTSFMRSCCSITLWHTFPDQSVWTNPRSFESS